MDIPVDIIARVAGLEPGEVCSAATLIYKTAVKATGHLRLPAAMPLVLFGRLKGMGLPELSCMHACQHFYNDVVSFTSSIESLIGARKGKIKPSPGTFSVIDQRYLLFVEGKAKMLDITLGTTVDNPEVAPEVQVNLFLTTIAWRLVEACRLAGRLQSRRPAAKVEAELEKLDPPDDPESPV